MPANKPVLRFQDGRVLKGHSMDFSAGRSVFHLLSESWPQMRAAVEEARLFAAAGIGSGPLQGYSLLRDPLQRSGEGARFPKNKLVVHFTDGHVLIGHSVDSTPTGPASTLRRRRTRISLRR